MTLYFNLLEKQININSQRQHNVSGIVSFWNRIKPEQLNMTIPSSNQQKEIVSLSGGFELPIEPPSVRVTNESIINCDSRPLNLDVLLGEIIAKIPIVLAELVIQINIDSQIDLHERIYRLHRTKKQLRITKCALLQNTNILLIKGIVRNYIEFYKNPPKYSSHISGNLQETYVDIPFKCTTSIIFNGTQPAAIIPNSINEVSYGTQSKIDTYEQEEADNSWHINQISTAFYNEQPFCEIVSNRIVELDEINNSILSSTIIEEKLVIDITIKILQYRQVAIVSIPKK